MPGTLPGLPRRPGQPAVPLAVQRLFWTRVRAGALLGEASASAGVSSATGERWFAEAGGVMPNLIEPPSTRKYRRLDLNERHQIAALKKARFTVRAIADELGRPASTISRELARHANSKGGYAAASAQARAEQAARERGRKASPAKLATNLRLRRQVQDRLIKKHSPEQIAHRLRVDFPEDPEMWVSHETIYQSIYVVGRGGLKRELAQQLRTGRALRKPRRQAQARTARQQKIPDMVMIADRPAEASDRAFPGHWEGDLITGAGNASAIGTLVERHTSFTLLLHLPTNHGALAVQEAIIKAMADLPATLRRTLTWDQGSEMANHAAIAEATGLAVYFCDPHSPWQRPSNENTNGLLRQYFPKGTDLTLWGPGILDQVALELNNRPRKRLGWATPAEALDRLLSNPDNPHGVALTP
jgi:transposase, IS30 family